MPTAFRELITYPNLLPFEMTEDNIDRFVGSLAASGVTHAQVNQLPFAMHPEGLAQPENVYLWFANFGPSLDLFVQSELNRGLYPEFYLEKNCECLLRFAAAARRHGVKPVLFLREPTFVPERFFARHPRLRGARVDNPVCSLRPVYALCVDRPEVQEHYRQMMAAMMHLVPDLAFATVFTSDSASGFDYNDLYAGPNGAGFNRAVPVEERICNFLTVLRDAGRTVNPDFIADLNCGITPDLRQRLVPLLPDGVTLSVYGLYDMQGGLEEYWGYFQYRMQITALDRQDAFQKRRQDIQERITLCATGGRDPICHVELPNYDWPRPLRYVPIPFDVCTLMKTYHELGARRLALWGAVNGPKDIAWEINRETMNRLNADITADPEKLITDIASKWVGSELAPSLVEAWRLCGRAWSEKPLPSFGIGSQKAALPGPLVPDLTAITREEEAYYMTTGLADLRNIQGVGYFIPIEARESDREYVLRELYERRQFAWFQQAMAILDQAIQQASDPARAVIQQQRDYLHVAYLTQRSTYNWYEAGSYLLPGEGTMRPRAFQAIIDDEIAVTNALIGLLDGRAGAFLKLGPSRYMTYEPSPDIVEQLRRRLVVMQSHREDPVRELSDRLAHMKAYSRKMIYDGEDRFSALTAETV